MKCPRCGEDGAIKNGGNRTFHALCGKFGFIPAKEQDDPTLAARAGWSPEHQMVHPAAPGFQVKGTSTLYREDGTVAAQWVKTSQDAEAMQAAADAMVAAMCNDLPRVKPRKASGTWRDDLLTVYPIGDMHVGMRAHKDETGDNWDLKIARHVHCEAMNALVQAVPATKAALIIDCGDTFHYDSLTAKTPQSGHLLDADGRFYKMIDVGVSIIRQCIESALQKHERVHFIPVRGNHAEVGAIWLARLLHMAYENEPRVTIDLSPTVFNYYRFGKVLIGAHHGHTCKADKLPGVMATDRAKDWGETIHRTWICGHVHHESKREYPGVMVESFATLAGKDAYATEGGWRSGRTMQAIVFHAEHGEVARSKVNAAMFGDGGP